MAWESRGGNGRYYTRSERVGNRVVRTYFGTGPSADFAALADHHRRARRAAHAAQRRLALTELATADACVATLCQAAETAASAALLAAGYHRHARGAWRRRRV